MVERRYGVGSRGRSPSSPRRQPPRSREFSPSRHRQFSPYRRHEREGYSREAKTSRRLEKRGHLDSVSNLRALRFSEFDDRDRDRNVVGGRGFRSPQRIEKRDNFDGRVSLSDYGDGSKGKYENGVSVGRSRRSYDEDSYRGDSSSTKFQWDHLLDGPRKSDQLLKKGYGLTHSSSGVGGTYATGSGGERDYYPQNCYSDSGRAGLSSISEYLDSAKPASMKYESGGRMYSHSYTFAHGRVDDMPISNLNGGDGSHTSTVASRYLNTDAEKHRYFHFRDELHLERRDVLHDQEDNYFEKKNDGFHFQDRFLGIGNTVEREIYKYKKEDDLMSSQDYLKGDTPYMVSSSQSKDYDPVASAILREGFPGYSATRDLHMPSDVIRGGSGLASQPTGFDGYSEKKQITFPRVPGDQFDDKRSSPRLYIGLPEERQGGRLYAEFGRSKIDGMSTRLNDVGEGYIDQHMSGIGVSSHTVDECSHKRYMGDDGLWDQYPSLQMQSTPDKFDSRGSLRGRKQDLEMLGTGSSRLNYRREEYSEYGGVKPEEHHADVAGGQWSNSEKSDLLQSRGYSPSFGRLYDSPRKRFPVADLSLVESPERRLRGKHVRDEILFEHDIGIRISTDGNGSRKIYNQVDVEDEIDLVHLLKKPKSSRSEYEKTWGTSSEIANDQPSSSKLHPLRLIKPYKSDSRDIKKRLGPVRRKLHVSQRLVHKYKPSIKKRLALAPPKKHATLPWLKNMSSNIMASDQNDSDGGAHDHDGDHLGDHLPLAKPEPPEKSEDFKQLVQSAFFKFLKQINETPIKRKKYMEQGKAGILKCIVCGSNSDEFVGTENMAMHAFTSKKVGLRSQHLGLHKALCVLMGWKNAEEPGSEWHCEVMTNEETSALKEDLIIWPPVVIVHNSTIDNMNPDERVIISTEKLDTKLRDMGFGSILKVCNGKPANQSVMLVKFSGTLSGLQEAERFHQSYVESKRGRAELKQLKSENRSSKGERQIMSGEREENFLYGHLGIAEDLDKLDFDTKKRCVLRSKKQILSIVGAPLDTEGETGCY